MQNLLIIPSIDIKDGKTVRVVQEIPELNCKGYSDDPIEMALIWRAENAKIIHIVDFNKAQNNSITNYKVIEEIAETVIVPLQLGGGIRTFNDAKEIIKLGVHRLVIGSMTYENPKEFEKCIETFGPKRITAAIDAIDNEVIINARGKKTGMDAVKFAKKLVEKGVERIVITDIDTNGKLDKPNFDLTLKIAIETGIKITHSGGISGSSDLHHLKQYLQKGIDSVIVGRALYENRFFCQRMWRIAENGIFD